MEYRSLQRGQAVRVFWHDSAHIGGWQYPTERDLPVRIERVATLGWVVGCSRDGINMTTTISKNGGVLSVVAIPWVSITSIQELDEWNRDSNLP